MIKPNISDITKEMLIENIDDYAMFYGCDLFKDE
jgi:hypothetical protein